MKNRHTVSYLTQLLGLAGAKPQRRFGQNFLIDLNLIELIARSADLNRKDVVLEVGTGTGSLTSHLAEQAGQVITVEVDPFMQRIASEELAEYENVTILKCDALASKHDVSFEIVGALVERLNADQGLSWKLVANLPYNIATPLIANLLLLNMPPVQMVVTIQLELAERIAAPPSTENYGALSVWIQSQADCQLVRKLPPHVFWPKPNVDSAVLKVVLNQEKRSSVGDLSFFHGFIHAMFAHRRKTLRSQLAQFTKERELHVEVQQLFETMGVSIDVRAEQLSVSQFVELARRIQCQ